MKRKLVMLAAVLLATVAGVSQNPPTRYVILTQNPGTGSTSFADALGSSVVARYDQIGVVVADSSDPNFAAQVSAMSGVQAVAQDQGVEWTQGETFVDAGLLDSSVDLSTLSGGPSSALPLANHEPFSPFQWNLHAVQSDRTADNGDRGNTVTRARVAIIDTGILVNHPDIKQNLNTALSASFVGGGPNGNFAFPENGAFSHATLVAGVVAAPINGFGIQGVAPDAEIVSVRVLNNNGFGPFSDIIAGLEYACGPTVHADVANMSLAGTFDPSEAGAIGPLVSSLGRAVDHATAQGCLVVSAAGNAGLDLNSRIRVVPAESGNGMAVSATGPVGFAVPGFNGSLDTFAPFSNFGQSVVDVAGPGGQTITAGLPPLCTFNRITASCEIFDWVLGPATRRFLPDGTPRNGFFFAFGTSFAAPHASGVAALVVGKFGHMPPAQLRTLLEQSADNVGDNSLFGHGRVNAVNALVR